MRPRAKTFSLLFLIAALFAQAGYASAAEKIPDTKKDSSSQQPYRLQSGDELAIGLFSSAGSGIRAIIQDDGLIFFPPIGTIQAAGLSTRELELAISEQLSASKTSAAEGSSRKNPSEIISPAEAALYAYQLVPGDQLDITVYKNDDLTQKIQLQEDGSFSFPLIGVVQAAGKTISTVEQEIRERLDKDFLINPQVTVRFSKAQFSILGQKGDSGFYEMDGSIDLLTAISKAGDIQALRNSQVEIIRRQGNKQVVVRSNIDNILNGKEPNLPILPRDTLYIRVPTQDNRQVLVQIVGAKFTALGEISAPGSYPIDGPLDLLTAISMSGGITKFGSSRVEIIRSVGEKKAILRANIDRILAGRDSNIAIHPRDTLYVKRRLF